jgi:hypothetical protein
MRKPSPHNGFILPTAIFLLFVCSFAIGSALTYVAFTTRMTAVHRGNSICRFAAQSAIEAAKRDIYKAFYSYSGSSARVGIMSGYAFNWFNTPPSDSHRIGEGSTTVTLPAVTNINGCLVTPLILRNDPNSGTIRTGRISNQPMAIVTLRATATRNNPGGTQSASTIEERVRFALMRSRVFDNAYFVNNYGWFQGSSITANGDVRANGNLYLDSGCTVNGHAYAARNVELNVIGSIENTGKMQNLSTYWSNCGTSARPSSPTYNGGGYYGGGYDPSVSVSERLHPYQDELTMPYISKLDDYVTYAQELGGNISGGISYKLDSNGNVTSSSLGTINAHYDGVGPSGNSALSDKGTLVIEGTQANPIVINGPVVVDSDVIIKGYVKGQGTIYSGRNIHIAGNIRYVNPPTWNHPDSNPTATEQANANKDFLGLAAKGNIVMGDYTLSSWLGSNNSNGLQYYLKNGPYVQQYACDPSDNTIGYPRTREYGWTSDESKFCGDYTQKDGGKKVEVSSKTEWVYEHGRRVQKTTTTIADTQSRRYYESVCPEKLIQHLCGDTQNSRTGAYSPTITRIDAVMYNNHGIIGHIGNCTINGSLVCRNEAMIYSGALKINWDHRLYSGFNGNIGLPMDASQPPMTLSWREISN